MERPLERGRGDLFGSLAGDEVRNPGELEVLVQVDEIGFDLPGAEQVDAGQQDAVSVSSDLARFVSSFSSSFRWVP